MLNLVRKRCNMIITASELKNNFEKYFDLAQHEEIIVTKNGKEKIKIMSAKKRPLDVLDGIFN